MTNAKRLEVLAENRKLIEIYSNLKEIEAQVKDDNLKIVLALIDKATDVLSEVWKWVTIFIKEYLAKSKV